MKGSMFKRTLRKPNPREKRSSPAKISFQDPVGHALPPSLSSFRWNVDKVERKLQEKIQEKTKIAGNFVYQQAYRLLECTRGEGIDFASFREQLRIKFGIILDDSELQLLFDKYDEDHNGTIDLNEFIRRVLPPDYNYGRQWFEVSQQESEERQASLKRESRQDFLLGMGIVRDELENTGETSHWTLETLLKQIQTKVVQKTPSGDDQYRRAFKMMRSGRDQGIRMRELRNNLKTKFGIFVSEKQMRELFSRFDIDGSGEIDLKEFLQFVEPPAYPANSKVPRGLWTEEDEGDELDGGGRAREEDHNRETLTQAEEQEEDGTSNGDHEPTMHCCHRREERLPSAAQLRQGQIQTHSQGPSTSTKNVIKKERPMSANPKKQAMLKQRREQQAASTTQLLERHLREAELEAQTQTLYGTSGRHSAAKATQTRRLTMSMADIHQDSHQPRAATAGGAAYHHNHTVSDKTMGSHEGLRYDSEDDDGGSSERSGASSGISVRPRSAGSVAGATSTASSSNLRGASYMRRPSTPQHLRQKCLESRLAGAVSSASSTDAKPKPKKRVSAGPTGHASAVNSTSLGVAKRTQNHGNTLRQSLSDDHSLDDEDDDGGRTKYDAPRVVRVHPKQHDPRPYSQGGRVLQRSKVSSSGCR